MKQNKFSKRFAVFVICIFFLLNFVFASSDYGEQISKDSYTISRSEIIRSVKTGTIFQDSLSIKNLKPSSLSVSLYPETTLVDVLELNNASLSIPSGEEAEITFFIKGVQIGNYEGYLDLKGDLDERIFVNISIVEEESSSSLLMKIEPFESLLTLGHPLKFKLNVNKLNKENLDNVSIYYSIKDSENKSYLLGEDLVNVTNSFQIIKDFVLPSEFGAGDYIVEVLLKTNEISLTDKFGLSLKISFLKKDLFGFLPVWLLFLILFMIVICAVVFYLIKKNIESKKKYKMKLDYKTLPKKSEDYLFLGHVAEKKSPVYLDPNKLTTHSIVAGATGGGKSISAQVIIEEALIKDIAVIVFDPTAQWSGMLRKCDDKKMMSFYPKFGLKQTDARAFKGNVRQVSNARQLIDINKYINPGQIQIFTLNKLDPKDMDMFVANVIRQVFKSDPKESPNLKVLLVFDEVHRLLSKFGGSGEGFLQIERACREFRKWGLGVMLVSQVLNDFVGEIKANISTEVQMRTRDEGDLNRINTKYGEEFLQSLVKASVGVGMFANPSYNHAMPYFINFRPILHSTRRLPDEELEKYNKYNDVVDDLEYQIEQLEAEKIDVFDLKMELKLVKDKIMSGNFSVVEIYLEGLTPRIEGEWGKLGKKPKKREVELVDEAEIKKSIEEAKKSREKFEKEEAKNVIKVAEKEEKLEEKEVKPLTFDNGIMVGSVKELKSVLETMDDEIFKIHVNDEKNDIYMWLVENFGEGEAVSIRGLSNRTDLIKGLGDFGKKKDLPDKGATNSNEVKTEEKKDSKTSEPDKDNKKGEVSNKTTKTKTKKDEPKKSK